MGRSLLVDSVPELPQEPLVVFLGHLEDPVDELLPVVHVELPDVDRLVYLLLDAVVLRERLQDARPQPVVGGQPLDGGPLEGLLVLVVPAGPRRVPLASEGALHPPPAPAHAPAHVPAHFPARLPPRPGPLEPVDLHS